MFVLQRDKRAVSRVRGRPRSIIRLSPFVRTILRTMAEPMNKRVVVVSRLIYHG